MKTILKFLKALIIWSGFSWTIYGVSMNVLNTAKYEKYKREKHDEDDVQMEITYEPALVMAVKNFKEAYRLETEN